MKKHTLKEIIKEEILKNTALKGNRKLISESDESDKALSLLATAKQQLIKLAFDGGLGKDELNQLIGDFTTELKSARRKGLNDKANKANPTRKADAAAKSKETRSRNKEQEKDWIAQYNKDRNQKDADRTKRKRLNLLPLTFGDYSGVPKSLGKYYDNDYRAEWETMYKLKPEWKVKSVEGERDFNRYWK